MTAGWGRAASRTATPPGNHPEESPLRSTADSQRAAPNRRVAAACRGDIPADVLSTRDRETVVARLHAAGCADVEIAEITRLTTYTTGRIRARLGLAAHNRRAAA